MSSGALRPTWKPFASDMLAEQGLHFSLRLMTGGDKLTADVQLWKGGELTNFNLRQAA